MTLSRFGRDLTRTAVVALVACTLWYVGAPAGAQALTAPAATAPAAAAAAAGTGPQTSVTVFLEAPNAPALQALADQPITDRAQRIAQLATLVPGTAQHSSVIAALAGAGFGVTHQTSWSVTASAPASVVTALFGTAASGLTALPQLPGVLSGLVSGAYLTTGGTPLLHLSTTTTLTGADVRNADAPAGKTPSSGANDAGLTVATLQLADFDSSDLTHYASDNNLTDPVATGAYTPVTVDGGPSAMDDAGEGDVEVALDQESILSTAPSAHQQPYFAPNTTAGFNDVFASAYDDVTGNAMATKPNPHLVAMSVSWGGCEAEFGTAADIATTQTMIASLVAAGVNIFAASGDDGIYDCRDQSGTGLLTSPEDVDFPASSPNVVAVGGTNLSAPSGTAPTDTTTGTGGTSPANTGTNWTEKSWSCTSAVSCEGTNVPTVGTGGTGGGISGAANGKTVIGSTFTSDFAGFAKPAYQSSAITTGPFAKPTKRMVPDIAADADPDTGFVTYTSDATVSPGGGDLQVGGTSLAAPLSTAQFANSLGDAGVTTGVGDIHAPLYRAYAATSTLATTDPTKAFRDVTVGSNGSQADATADPSVAAGPGYDTNTGLGGVLWATTTPYLLQQGSLTVNTSLSKHVEHRRHHHKKRTVQASWSATGPATDPVGATTVRITRGAKTLFTSTAATGTKSVAGRHGHYRITVTSTDAAGRQTTRTSTLHIHRGHHHHGAH